MDIENFKNDMDYLIYNTDYGTYEYDFLCDDDLIYEVKLKIYYLNDISDISIFLEDFSNILNRYNVESYKVKYCTIKELED